MRNDACGAHDLTDFAAVVGREAGCIRAHEAREQHGAERGRLPCVLALPSKAVVSSEAGVSCVVYMDGAVRL